MLLPTGSEAGSVDEDGYHGGQPNAFDVTITAIAEFVSDPDAFGGAP
jgi:hypothetical protein